MDWLLCLSDVFGGPVAPQILFRGSEFISKQLASQTPTVIRAQEASVGRFIGEPSNGGQAHVDGGGREVFLFEENP